MNKEYRMKKLYQVAALAVMAGMLVAQGRAQAAPVGAIPGSRGDPSAAGYEPNRVASAAAAPAAFPGAEGFGAHTVGGRGGTVYEVTNTADSGGGSLRACVQASGPRTCVFRIGGLIKLSTPLTISNPYITIAGQTAPGGGITVRTASGGDVFATKTSEVIMRYLTVRPGPGGSNHADQIASNGVALNDIMIDHMTFSWGVDSDIETWYRVVNLTIQWSIISEALDCSTHPKGCHSKGLMIGGYQKGESDSSKGSENISVHHNLMAHDSERTPLMQLCGIAQVINNITYNPQWTFAHQQDNCTDKTANNTINWIGNYHKKGPDSTSSTDLKVLPADSGTYSHVSHVYVKDNIGPSRSSNSQPDSNWVESGSRSYIVTIPASAPNVTTTDAQTAYDSVLGDAGNSKGLDCNGNWYSRRDAIDTRVVNDVRNGTGHIIDDPSDVGGWITPASGTPCLDSDHDGMPDVWELIRGLNPNNVMDGATDRDGDGYTNLEEFLDGINSAPTTPIPTATSSSTPFQTPTATLTYTPASTYTPTIIPITQTLTQTVASRGAQDGWIREYAAGSGTGGIMNTGSSAFLLGDDRADRQYRSVLSFNTAVLPDDAVITSVTLKIKRQSTAGTDPFGSLGSLLVDTRQPFFGGALKLEKTDFAASDDHDAVASIPNTPDPGGWYSVDLPSDAFDAINLAGTTQLRLRFETGSNGNHVADVLKFFSGNAAAARRPMLVIQYDLP